MGSNCSSFHGISESLPGPAVSTDVRRCSAGETDEAFIVQGLLQDRGGRNRDDVGLSARCMYTQTAPSSEAIDECCRTIRLVRNLSRVTSSGIRGNTHAPSKRLRFTRVSATTLLRPSTSRRKAWLVEGVAQRISAPPHVQGEQCVPGGWVRSSRVCRFKNRCGARAQGLDCVDRSP